MSACVCRTSENCKSLVLQDKCNIEIFFPCLIWTYGTTGPMLTSRILNSCGIINRALSALTWYTVSSNFRHLWCGNSTNWCWGAWWRNYVDRSWNTWGCSNCCRWICLKIRVQYAHVDKGRIPDFWKGFICIKVCVCVCVGGGGFALLSLSHFS